MSKFATYLNAATEFFNAGFASKAAQQRALDYLNRAYDYLKQEIHDDLLAIDRAARDSNWNDLYWGVPALHVWKAKHSAMFPAFADRAQLLVDLRANIKSAPITPPIKSTTVTEFETKVRETVKDMIDRRMADYRHGIELVSLFGRLPVTVVPHWVVNDKGTGFVRCFFYMNGKLTALNVILAVLDATRDEEAK